MPEATITKAAIIKLKRECSHCGHVWLGEIEVKASGKANNIINKYAAIEEASKEASRALEEKVMLAHKTDNPNEAAICPKCGNLSTVAMKKYFPNGYIEGVKKMFIGSGKGELTISIISLIGIIIASFIAYKIFTREHGGDFPILLTLVGVVFVGLGFWALYEFWMCSNNYIRYLNNYNRVIKRIESSSSEELFQIIIDCYHKDKNSINNSRNWLDSLI